ncbi:WD repeatcontaining protein [Acanthamoeba castellanii str. Neff]|uniref:WD repeatcontaining protein n=1 Tax=Acanthamoeba castellanii (strain ATCC 30010 / Neff) TaxID=1257118 RepID=L8HEW8_ACACF|nr:WD repeatcontaining protein [Acanthamoeba castellanii str. Neff]ELR23705.1 WD repeatcontaining protein [Acanthamoeba castellanii str. Neff]
MLAIQEARPSIHVWSWAREQPVLRFSIPEKLGVVAVSHDGLYCAAGAPSGKLYLWQVATGRMLKMWEGHYKGVTALAWTTDDMFLLSGGEDALLHLWSLASVFDDDDASSTDETSVRPEHTWNEHALPITSIFCGVGGVRGRILTTSNDQTCKVWDIPSRRMAASLKFPSCLTTVTVDVLERHLFAGSVDGRVYAVDLTMPLPASNSDAMFMASEGGLLDMGEEKVFDTLSAHDRHISSLSVSLDGNLLLSASHDGTAKMWDLGSRQVIRTFTTNKGPITYASIIAKPFSEDMNIDDRQTDKPFKTFLHRNEQSGKTFSRGSPYSAGDVSTLLVSMAVPTVLGDTKLVFTDLLDEEEEPESYLPLTADLKAAEGEEGVLEQQNRELQKRVVNLEREVARWSNVNNGLYRFCVTQLLAAPTQDHSVKQPQEPHHH